MHDLICNCGFSFLQEAIHLIQDGNIIDRPMLMPVDIKRTIDLSLLVGQFMMMT